MPSKHKRPAEADCTFQERTMAKLYRWQASNNPGAPFVLHDGPPYANGNLHMGHVLNKVLKDIIVRYKILGGYRVHYAPGWDCHGLPIEQKALKAVDQAHTSMEPLRVREIARQTVLDAIEIQKTEMKALGLMADWDNPDSTYRTMDYEAQIRQLRLFGKMVDKGLVTHRLRPVYYSPAARTALAEAELRYREDHRSRSVYIGFPVAVQDMTEGLRDIYERVTAKSSDRTLYLALWTTTAWSLPGNAAVNVSQDSQYAIVLDRQKKLLVVMKARLEAIRAVLGPLDVLDSFSGDTLIGTRYTHPFHPESCSSNRPVVFHSAHVTDQSGTGLVHTAPAHAHEDYRLFAQADRLPLNLRCPIDDDGRFTEEVNVWCEGDDAQHLVGKHVLKEGTTAIIDLLRKRGLLLAEEVITHKYPYDWKTKEPVIIRATPQWFADVESVKARAMEAIEKVNFQPPHSRHRLESFIMGRSEWCISRQRSWGVPIPVLHTLSGEAVLSSTSIAHAISVLADKGIDHWWKGPVEDFIPPEMSNEVLTKGLDTLDVWFDSGASWTLIAKPATDSVPLADVYLEGSDQHRGWFQSSLLTRISTTDEAIAPYATLITHGFVMDENGDKMSKSAGNGLSPMELIHGVEGVSGLGADVLRVWVASVDYHRDVRIGRSSIAQSSEIVRRWRNSVRYLVGNTAESSPPLTGRSLLDQYVLHEIFHLEKAVKAAYDSFSFSKALHAINTFISSTLSSLYFETIKDTLYCDDRTDASRQDVVATLSEMTQALLPMIAPITPHLAEEAYAASIGHKTRKSSVFEELWCQTPDWSNNHVKDQFGVLLDVRVQVMAMLESVRTARHIRNSFEADLYLSGDQRSLDILIHLGKFLARLLTVSSVNFNQVPPNSLWSQRASMTSDLGELRLVLVPASGARCPRCWLFRSSREDSLCVRCANVVASCHV